MTKFKWISVRLEEPERQAIRLAAAAKDMSQSDVVRIALFGRTLDANRALLRECGAACDVAPETMLAIDLETRIDEMHGGA